MKINRQVKNNEVQENNGYLSLCYHYVHSRKNNEQFSKILGTDTQEFCRNLKMLCEEYDIISLNEARSFSYDNLSLRDNSYGMLITFDDGLADHYAAARILAKQGIKAVFFIPTCVLIEKLPANPTIIHYCLAKYKINDFLKVYRNALEECGLDNGAYNINFRKSEDDPWEAIKIIKALFKYKLKYQDSRKVLIFIYRALLLKDYSNCLEMMHLQQEQIHDIIAMGHSIGVHSHSHISIAATELSTVEFQKEMIEPRLYLQKVFGQEIFAFSYPYGGAQDCLANQELSRRDSGYQLAFTVEEIVNTKSTSPYELGRYMLNSQDSAVMLKKKLNEIKSTQKACLI